MNPQKISKYYYHHYVLFAFFLLTISALFAIFSLDFTPTDHVKICAFILAIVMYLVILIYFYMLHRQGEWVIPRTWKNAKKKPKFYFLLLLPLFAILICYLNLVFYPPLLHTLVFGTPSVVTVETSAVKEQTYKHGVSYFLDTAYDGSGIFRLSSNEYEHYKNQVLQIKLSVIQGQFGTYIKKIESIQIVKATQNK